MLSRFLLNVLWATVGVVVAHPTVEARASNSTIIPPSASTNSSAAAFQQPGFEVVIVYVKPEGGCRACPTDHASQLPALAAVASTATVASSPIASPTEEPAFSQSGPNIQLPPNVHWSWDTSSPANVIPVPAHSGSPMYYGHTDPSQSGYFAFLTYYFTIPSVNLDHCDHVTGITCTETGCIISFGTSDAYQHAVDTWSTEIVLIAYTEGCSAYADGDRCYFRVTALDFKDGLVIEVQGAFVKPDDHIAKGETEWGWWTPRTGGSGTGSTGGSGSAVDWSGSSGSTGGSGSGSGSTGSGSGSGSASNGSGSGSGGSTNPSGGSTGPSNTTTSANDTSSFSDTKSACVPPVDTKYGLPTACLGDLFDQDLDDGLGYPADGSAAFDTFINAVAPGMEDYTTAPDPSDDDDLGAWASADRRSVSRRGAALKKRICFSCAFKKVVHAVTHPAETITTIKNAVQQATSISGSVNKDLSFKLPDPSNAEGSKLQDSSTKQITSPWGDSILLKSFGTPAETTEKRDGSDKKLTGYMNVFCVGCGVSGHANVAGRASWTPLGGFTQGQVELRTDIQFVFKLGIDAQLNYNNEFNNNLLRLGLPGLSYGVVTIGPWIEVGSHVTLNAQAKGRLLAGAEMGLQNAHVLIDFINPSNSQKDGWDPYFKPVFEADGEIMLSATLGLPVAIKCGLQVASFSKSVGLIDEPSLTGTAQVAASIGLAENGGFAAGFKDTDGCTGISTQISWRNKLFIDVLGLTTLPLLDSQDKPLARGCIKLPALPSTPSTPTDNGSGDQTSPSVPTDTNASTPADSPSPTSDTNAAAPADNSTPTDPANAGETPEPVRKRSIAGRIVSPLSGNGTTSTNTTSTNTTGTVLDLTSKVKSNATSLSYAPTSLPNIPYNSTDGYEFNLLTVSDASVLFITCGNGGVYAVSPDGADNPACNSMWETYQDVVVADAADRVLHYYNNTMSAVGVSRLRVGDSDDVPETGVLVAFAPDDGDEGFFFAVDADLSVFYPVLCTYADGGAAKMFLAADPDAGPLLLQSPDLEFSVTGGKVDKCFAMPLLMGQFEVDGYDSYDNSTSSDDALELDWGNGEETQE